MAKDKILLGLTGEYYVAAKLSSLGLKVALAANNTPDFDLFVSDGKNQKMVQVKTTFGPKADWVVSLVEPKPNVIFVLVLLKSKKDCDCPSYYIVKGDVIRKHQDAGYAVFVENHQKKNGKNSKPPPIEKVVNKFKDFEGKYINNWKTLGLKLTPIN